jgi:hypothetical protein
VVRYPPATATPTPKPTKLSAESIICHLDCGRRDTVVPSEEEGMEELKCLGNLVSIVIFLIVEVLQEYDRRKFFLR